MMYIFLSVTGVLAGFLNGFVGSGGGIILIYAMCVFARIPHSPDLTKTYFATAVASILPMSFVSAYFYIRGGAVSWNDVLPFLLPAALGGVTGAFLMDRLSPKLLKMVFSALMVWAGLRVIL